MRWSHEPAASATCASFFHYVHRRKPLEEIWYIMHALLLRENALKTVLLTRIELG